MKRFRNLTIATKLSLLFVAFAALILVGVGSLAYLSGRAALEQAVTSDLQSTANEKQAAFNRWLNDRLNLVVSITELPANRARVNSLILDDLDESARGTLLAQTTQALEGFTGPNGNYMEMMIVEAAHGQVIVSTQAENQGKFNEDRPYFIEGLKGPFVQNIIYSLGEQVPLLIVSAPIKADDGSVIAVLAARLKLDEMNEIISRRSGQHETDDAFLVDSSNLFVTQPRFITDPAVLQRGVHTDPVNRCLAGNSGVLAANDYRGVPVLAVYRWLSERQLCLIVKMDQVEAFVPSNKFGQTLALISVATLALASLLGFGLARTITTPLHVLRDGVVSFGRGEHDVRMPAMARDEIGVLAHEFNNMAASLAEKDARLREYATGLEFKVEERTAAIKEREERYRTYIEVTGQLGWTTNANGEVEEEMSSWRKYTGQDESEVKGWGWSKALHPDDLERATQAWNSAVAARTNYEVEYRIRRYDGVYRHFLARGVPVLNGHGEILEWVGTCIDLTDRKRMEEALLASEARYRSTLDAMLEGCQIIGFDWRYLYLNDVANMHNRRPGEELLGNKYMDMWPGIEATEVFAVIRRCLEERVVRTMENEFRFPDGGLGWFELRIYPIPEGIVILSVDITERKRTEKQLAEYAVQLEEVVNERTRELRDAQEQLVRQERLAILGQLAGSMGHELRNPLGVISNAIYFLKVSQPDASDKIKEYLNIIENEARTSDKIITDLLDFARVKSVDRQPVSVPEVIHQTLNRFPVPPSVEKVLTIPFDLPRIFADPHHMVQILGNLTVNACQALPDTGGRLEISAALRHDMVSIAIHDNGVGISPENMNKFFEPLFTTKIKGIGLGLAVSRKLAEANGGRIEVKSEAGQGSTFTVWIPVHV